MTSSFPYKLVWTPSGFYQVMKEDKDALPGCLYDQYSRKIVKRSNPTIVIGKYNEQTRLFEINPTAYETRKFNPESGLFVNDCELKSADFDKSSTEVSTPVSNPCNIYKPSLEGSTPVSNPSNISEPSLEGSTPVSNPSNVSEPFIEQLTPTPTVNMDDELALRTEPLSTQLEKLAAKLRKEESKMDFEERKLLSPKVLDADSKELAQLQFSSATTLDLLESMQDVFSKLKPKLEEKNKFVNSIKEYCHLDRHELIKLLFEKDKQLSSSSDLVQKDLERRNVEYDELLYRFKFVCSIFCSTLADPSGVGVADDNGDITDYSGRFNFLNEDVLDWKRIDYQLWKLSEWDDGIVRSKHTPVKAEWDLKPWKHD